MTGHVFISFDRGDAIAYVDGLARYLTAAGIPVWYDREVGGDQRWAQVVAQLQTSAAVVVVMTPGGERSEWVTSEIAYARQLGRPVLPLLLGGTTFPALADLPVSSVPAGEMPDQAFLDRLRGVAPYPPVGPQAVGPRPVGPPAVGPQAPGPQGPGAAPRRTGLIVGIVAAAAVLLLCLVGVVGVVAWQLSRRGEPGSDPTSAGQTWEDQANSIDGIQNYLVSHPEWYEYDPTVGNHREGTIRYPIQPPAGGLHNPRWQNCMGDVYPAQVPQEQVMHSLEHGAVWVTYRPDLPKAQVDQLAGRVRNVEFMLMSPYPGLDRPISLQAWGYQLRVDNADDRRIDAFIKALRRNATQEPSAPCSGGITDTGATPLRFP